MGPSHDRPNPDQKQGRRRRCGPRQRRCLLKGCECWFQPTHAQARYCSHGCRRAAAQWRRWKASQRYRQTIGGRACRREQSRRRRARLAERKQTTDQGIRRRWSRVGHRLAKNLHRRAIDLAATTPSIEPVVHRRSVSAVTPVVVRSNTSSNVSDAGTSDSGDDATVARARPVYERSVLQVAELVA